MTHAARLILPGEFNGGVSFSRFGAFGALLTVLCPTISTLISLITYLALTSNKDKTTGLFAFSFWQLIVPR